MNVSPESKRRLEIVLQIVDDWWGGLISSDQSTEEEVAETERRLGITIPSTMRYWYSVANNLSERASCFGMPDHFFALRELEIKNGFLIICVENQAVWYGCIAISDLELNDPPIYFYDWNSPDEMVCVGDRIFRTKQGTRFSEFLLLEIGVRTVWKGQYFSEGKLDDMIFEFLEEKSKMAFNFEGTYERLIFSDKFLLLTYESKDGDPIGQISIKHIVDVRDLQLRIPEELKVKWTHQHHSFYNHWGHNLTHSCKDLILPFPENIFPDCHFESPSRNQATWNSLKVFEDEA